MLSALVVGGDGLIGSALTSHLSASGWKVVSTTRQTKVASCQVNFDLTQGISSLSGPSATVPANGLVVFICAAVTGFAQCSNDPEGSRHTNVTCTVELARHFMQQGAMVTYLSSNAVFDGVHGYLEETAAMLPVTEYGRQKAECEKNLMEAASSLKGYCAVVRLTKVVDRRQPLFRGWTESFSKGVTAKAAADLVMSPITTSFVVKGLQRIGSNSQSGIFHLSGERDLTYFELAQEMANKVCPGALIEKDWVRQRLDALPAQSFSALSMVGTTIACGLRPQPLAAVVRELTE
jgi:dTDP-4-dehydrorhamnose reductase